MEKNKLVRLSDVIAFVNDERNQFDLEYEPHLEAFRQRLDSIPAVDAVEVVRCGDCVHLNRVHMNISGNYMCDRYAEWQDESNRVHMPWTGFCSYGQRREDGDA